MYSDSVESQLIDPVGDEKIIDGVLYKRRFSLKIPITKRDSKNSIVVILKNPSQADKSKSDLTINKVIEYILRNEQLKDHDQIIIVNLLALYRTSSKEIKSIIKCTSEEFVAGNDSKLEKNDSAIINAITESKTVILAWGNHALGIKKLYDYRVQTVLKMVYQLQKQKKVYYVKSLSKYDNPRHAQVWGYENSLHSCLIEKKIKKYSIIRKNIQN